MPERVWSRRDVLRQCLAAGVLVVPAGWGEAEVLHAWLDAQAGRLAGVLDGVDDLAREHLRDQLVVELELQRDRVRALALELVAVERAHGQREVVRAELVLVPVDVEADTPAVAQDPRPVRGVQRGDGRILLRFNDLLKDFHAHVIFATDKSIAARPEALRGFLKGWFETIAFMRTNKAETVRISRSVMGTDEATTATIYDELMAMFSDTGKFEPKALAVLSRSFVEMKTLPAQPDMTKLYTEDFLQKK